MSNIDFEALAQSVSKEAQESDDANKALVDAMLALEVAKTTKNATLIMDAEKRCQEAREIAEFEEWEKEQAEFQASQVEAQKESMEAAMAGELYDKEQLEAQEALKAVHRAQSEYDKAVRAYKRNDKHVIAATKALEEAQKTYLIEKEEARCKNLPLIFNLG